MSRGSRPPLGRVTDTAPLVWRGDAALVLAAAELLSEHARRLVRERGNGGSHSCSSRLAQHDLDRIGETTSRLLPRVLFGSGAGGEAHFAPTVRVGREKMQALRY